MAMHLAIIKAQADLNILRRLINIQLGLQIRVQVILKMLIGIAMPFLLRIILHRMDMDTKGRIMKEKHMESVKDQTMSQ
jgi:phosphotransferase system  glucose/maltose/N-acetylglucosamine-specific IIC component